MTVATIQHMMEIINRWAMANGIPLSGKTTAIWIHPGKKIASSYPTRPLLLLESPRLIVQPLKVGVNPKVRILGLWVDSTLSFTQHAEYIQDRVASTLKDLSDRFPYMAPSLRYAILEATCHSRILHLLPCYWSTLSVKAKDTLCDTWSAIAQTTTNCMRTTRTEDLIVTSGCRLLPTVARLEEWALWTRFNTLPPQVRALYWEPLRITSSSPRQEMAKSTAESDKGCIRDKLVWRDPAKDIPWKDSVTTPLVWQTREYTGLGTIRYKLLNRLVRRCIFHTVLEWNGKSLTKDKESIEILCAFNAQQLSKSMSQWELWTDGSVEPGEASSGAYLIARNGKEVARGALSHGPYACSYSMERAALLQGMRNLCTYVEERNEKIQSLRVVTDSLSVLTELQRGFMYQSEEEMEEIWVIAAMLSPTILHWVFVFSYRADTDTREGNHKKTLQTQSDSEPPDFNQVVDEYAQKTLSSKRNPDARIWARDITRLAKKTERERHDNSPEIQSTFQFQVLESGAPLKIRFLGMPRRTQILLLQLRAGACPQLPGWKHEQPEPCPHCGQLIGRRSVAMANPEVEHAVAHVFKCPNYPSPHPLGTLRRLFEGAPGEALKFVRAFIDGARQVGKATL